MASLRRPPLILELDLTRPLADPHPGDALSGLRARGRRLLRPTVAALHEAAGDRRVAALVAKVGGPLSWATMQDLRAGVRAFADGGKPTVAWAETFPDGAVGTTAYVLASSFDEVWLQPGGELGLLGVVVESTFLRGTLDKLGIEPQLRQRHEYKMAGDVYTRTEPSPAHREVLESLADSVFADGLATIAAGRRISTARARELVDSGPRTAAEALAARLVDRLGYRDEVLAALRARVGQQAELVFADRWRPRRRLRVPGPCRDRVALVEVRGGIASGRSRPGLMGTQAGSDTVAAELRASLADDRVRALVLRVESPGGSAIASEVIWREVCRVRDAGKPVVASMGDIAASGGYYVSCPATRIVAQPATLTGSIGVVTGKLVAEGLARKAGLTSGAAERGERARMWSGWRGFTDAEWERVEAVLDAIYVDFVGKVAAGRGRAYEEIEPLARGRVWTGRDAYERGLVDALGGLRTAARLACSLAGLPADAPVRPALRLPPLARLGSPRSSDDPRALLGGAVPRLDGLDGLGGLVGLDGIQLRMPDVRLR